MSRILLVEDHPVNSRLFCEWLKQDGFDVDAVETADAAMEHLNQIHFDLIVMDIALPGTDGLTLSAMIRQSESTCHIPIVCVSAYLQGHQTRSGSCDIYLQKPVDRQVFLLQIRSLLGL